MYKISHFCLRSRTFTILNAQIIIWICSERPNTNSIEECELWVIKSSCINYNSFVLITCIMQMAFFFIQDKFITKVNNIILHFPSLLYKNDHRFKEIYTICEVVKIVLQLLFFHALQVKFFFLNNCFLS